MITSNDNSNSQSPPHLTVYTQVANSNGGLLSPSSFYVHVTDASNTEHSFKGDETGHIVYLPVGSYKTAVSGPKGYTASILGLCSGNAMMGNDFQSTVKMQ